MTKRHRQGWPAPCVPLLTLAGLSLCLSADPGWGDDSRNPSRDGPPPPPSVNSSDSAPAPAPAPAAPDPKIRALSPDSEAHTSSTESDVNTLDAALLATIRTALNPLLIRDRRHWLLLLRGEDALQQGDAPECIANFQALLDAPQDAFYWGAQSAQPSGAQANVVRRIRELPETARHSLERLQGPVAGGLRDQYAESHNRRLLFELFRRFGYSDAAREAAVQDLLIARDAGRPELAAEWGRFLAADTHHWQRLTPDLRELIAETNGVWDTAGIATGDASISRPPSANGAPSALVNRDSQDVVITPPCPLPVWTVRFDALEPVLRTGPLAEGADELSAEIRNSVNDWLSDRIENRLPIATANEALIAGETLIVRDFARLSAFDLTTGAPRWSYRCNTSLMTQAEARLDQQGSKGGAGSLDFETFFSGDPVFGRLTTDGNRVFLLDQVHATSGEQPRRANDDPATYSSTSSPSHRPNQLLALPVQALSRRSDALPEAAVHNDPLWTRGTQSSVPNDELADHAFLGRPLCVGDRVFVLAESDRQISLWALDAATGQTLWMQGVALINQTSATDSLRARTACSPLYSEGVVACPTEVGVVVGVDALSGHLLWVYDHLDEDQRTNSGRWTFGSGPKNDRQPLAGHAVVHRGHLFYLPRRSAFVHCLDLRTGTEIWTTPKDESYAIGAVTDDLILLLGDRECRALRCADRRPLWRTVIAEPAGLGIIAGNRYLLPTSQGPCLAINLEGGQIEGEHFGRVLHDVASASTAGRLNSTIAVSDAADAQMSELIGTLRTSPAGNLLAEGDLIVAATPLGVSVFAQSRPALERLQASGPVVSDEDLLMQVQLQLTLGDEPAAAAALDRLMSRRLEPDIQEPAEQLLLEILYAQLEHSADPRALLSRIAQLNRTDEQRLRMLLCQIDVALRCEDAELLIGAIEQFQTLPPTGLLAIDGDAYQSSPQQCVWERLSRLRADRPSELQRALIDQISHKASLLQNEQDVEELEQFVTLFAGWEPVAAPRLRLARQWIAVGRHQEAELLLLCDRFQDEPDSAIDARQQLAELYAQQGLSTKPTQPADTDISGAAPSASAAGGDDVPNRDSGLSVIGTALVALDSRVHSARLHRTAFGPSTTSPRIQIAEHICGDGCARGEACACERVHELHRDTRRRFIPKQTDNLIVLDRGTVGPDKTESRLVIADRDQGLIRGEINVPAAYWQTPQPLTAETGHVMVIGGESAFGLSLLEGKLLWSAQPRHSGRRPEKFKIGPIGSDFCVLQTSRELRVVHPATGQTLWLRNNLPPGIGLEKNDSTGVIGDSQTLTVFAADQTAFTVYHTQSGRELARGSRPESPDINRRHCWAVGRRLVELVTDSGGARLMVWDSRENQIKFDVPLMDRLCCPLPNESDFAFVTAEGRLQILDVTGGRLCLDLPVSSTRSGFTTADARLDAKGLVVFSDQERYYVNFMTDDDRVDTGSTAAEDQLAFPSVRVRGRLLAIDRGRQETVWDRPVADACLPLRPDTQLPMLVLVRQRRDESVHKARGTKDQVQRLMIEVLDAATGATLGNHDDLLLAQFVDCPVTRLTDAAGQSHGTQLSLVGKHSRVDVTLVPQRGEPPLRTAAIEGDTVDR